MQISTSSMGERNSDSDATSSFKKFGGKSSMDFDKKTSAAIDSLNAYEALVDDCCSKQKQCKAFFLETLSLIQKDDEELRIRFHKSGLKQYNELAEDAYSKILKANEDMVPIFDNISVGFDSDLFSKMINYHSESLSDVKMFENLVYNC